MDQLELGSLFSGLRAEVTVADEAGRIVFLNDRAIAHYKDHGGQELIGKSLYDCHRPSSQAKIQEFYARYRAGDLSPIRYHKDRGNGTAQSIVYIPIIVAGHFRGIAELMWVERRDLSCDI